MTPTRPPFAARPVAIVVLVQAAVLLAMAPFYGPHRDELYFVSAGRRLDWGYPDQPAFTPLLARISTEVAPESLVVLHLWSILAVVGTVLAGIDSCDPAVLDSLPAFDLTGYDAERYRIQAPDDAPDWDDLPDADQAAAIDAVRDGFTTAVEDVVAARCAALLDGENRPTE